MSAVPGIVPWLLLAVLLLIRPGFRRFLVACLLAVWAVVVAVRDPASTFAAFGAGAWVVVVAWELCEWLRAKQEELMQLFRAREYDRG